jgi:hypothetical protein
MASATTHTSNDLLRSLAAKQTDQPQNYTMVAQSVNEVRELQNAPSISMGPYLIESNQTRLLGSISIYGQRGTSNEQIRLLYMNETALRIWMEMGKRPKLLGTHHRPPRVALLSFGVPFSE